LAPIVDASQSIRGTSAERIADKAGRPVLVVNRESTQPYQNVLLTSDLSGVSIGVARVNQDVQLVSPAALGVLEHVHRQSGCIA
jgi:hypothetical protein